MKNTHRNNGLVRECIKLLTAIVRLALAIVNAVSNYLSAHERKVATSLREKTRPLGF